MHYFGLDSTFSLGGVVLDSRIHAAKVPCLIAKDKILPGFIAHPYRPQSRLLELDVFTVVLGIYFVQIPDCLALKSHSSQSQKKQDKKHENTLQPS